MAAPATPEVATDISFSNAETGRMPTPGKLNLLLERAVIQPGAIANKPPSSGVAAGDYVLVQKADGKLYKVPANTLGSGSQGPKGDPGPPNVLSVASTTTGAPGTNAAVSISGTSPAQALAFTIPTGQTGPQGPPGGVGPPGSGMNWRGDWDPATAYLVNDAVEENGSSYLCRTANTGQDPATTSYWDLFAQRGDQGLSGLDGAPVGTVIPFSSTTIPLGYLLCDGSVFLVANWPALFAVVGTKFGGNGTTTFGVPDLRGKFVLGAGLDPGPPALTNRVLGAEGGVETYALISTEMPAHVHGLASHTHTMGNHTHLGADHLHPMDHFHNMDHYHLLSNHTHLGVDHLHAFTGVNHLHDLNGHVHSYNHPATGGPTWASGGGWTDAASSSGGPNTTSGAADRSLASTTGAMDRGATTGGPSPNNTNYASQTSASWANTLYASQSAAAWANTGAADRGLTTGGPSTNVSDGPSVANTASAGSGVAHQNMPPFCVLVYVIKAGEGDYENGVPGPPGISPTVDAGTTVTSAPGTSALVTNSGTPSAAVFDFRIPRGDVGAQGPPGSNGTIGVDGAPGKNAWTLTTTSPFTVPAYGSTVVVNVADTSWIAIGEWLWADDGDSSGVAGQLIVTAKTPTSVTLLNPQPTVSGIPLADTTQNGLLRLLSGLTTDFVDGSNHCQNLISTVIAALFPVWTPFTATISAQTGAVSAQTSASAYLQIGKTIFVNFSVTVSNIGTASGYTILGGLPLSKRGVAIYMRENAVNGYGHTLVLGSGSGSGTVQRYDNIQAAWTNGMNYNGFAVYEAA